MDKHFHIAELISKRIKGTLIGKEALDLQKWLNENSQNEALIQKLSQNQHLLRKLNTFDQFENKKSWDTLEAKLFDIEAEPLSIWRNTNKLLRYAASLLLPFILLSGLTYYLLILSPQDPLSAMDNTIKPAEPKATLILSDGQSVALKKLKPLKAILQGNTNITNQDHSLTYIAESSDQKEETLYNELITPKGGSYQLTLSDGPKVWLNAASSLRFPVAFTDTIRQVFLVGEAMFDVNHNGKQFIISADDMDIEVLGTTFNISSYPEEPNMTSTLVEGSIKLITPEFEKILVPNDQAVLSKRNLGVTISQVNPAYYTSWTRGKIEFNRDNLGAVMRRLARYYDFEYSFENEEAREFHFTASIESADKISTILKMIELTSNVKFEMKDNTLVVK